MYLILKLIFIKMMTDPKQIYEIKWLVYKVKYYYIT